MHNNHIYITLVSSQSIITLGLEIVLFEDQKGVHVTKIVNVLQPRKPIQIETNTNQKVGLPLSYLQQGVCHLVALPFTRRSIS